MLRTFLTIVQLCFEKNCDHSNIQDSTHRFTQNYTKMKKNMKTNSVRSNASNSMTTEMFADFIRPANEHIHEQHFDGVFV